MAALYYAVRARDRGGWLTDFENFRGILSGDLFTLLDVSPTSTAHAVQKAAAGKLEDLAVAGGHKGTHEQGKNVRVRSSDLKKSAIHTAAMILCDSDLRLIYQHLYPAHFNDESSDTSDAGKPSARRVEVVLSEIDTEALRHFRNLGFSPDGSYTDEQARRSKTEAIAKVGRVQGGGGIRRHPLEGRLTEAEAQQKTREIEDSFKWLEFSADRVRLGRMASRAAARTAAGADPRESRPAAPVPLSPSLLELASAA